ncbi:hypothetical protein A6769_37520 [Nostoc punctiforme NIES-2108]|uniref:Peptidase M10 serralysin C-terminal domain-containing protein n=1 Tax=Nostoc punctiforme NIES-2108 TaxID=1356359 RepID=A0A367S2H7_NOSPU|nr:hypothetical protein A6769_37520 [Nostoc punctiforme NIES-2108]
MANIIRTKGNDNLYANGYDNTLTGGGGNDIYNYDGTYYTITDFGGVAKGVNSSAAETVFLTYADTVYTPSSFVKIS